MATYLAANLVAGLASTIAAAYLVAERPSAPCPLRPLLRFGARGFGGTVANMANARLDQMIIVPFVGSAQLGLYAVSVTLATFPVGVAQAIAVRSFGEIARSLDRAGETARYFRLTTLVALLTCAGVGIAAPWGLPLLYGSAFRGSLVPLFVLLPGTVALAIMNSSLSALLIFDRPGLSSLAELVGLTVTLAGLGLLLQPMGVTGAALVSSVSYACTLAVHIMFLRRLGVRGLLPRRHDVSWLARRAAFAARHINGARSTKPRTE